MRLGLTLRPVVAASGRLAEQQPHDEGSGACQFEIWWRAPGRRSPQCGPVVARELLAAFPNYDPALLRRALLGEAGSGSAARDLLADAIECAEDEAAR